MGWGRDQMVHSFDTILGPATKFDHTFTYNIDIGMPIGSSSGFKGI